MADRPESDLRPDPSRDDTTEGPSPAPASTAIAATAPAPGVTNLVVPGIALLLLVAHFPALNLPAWAPRLGLTLALAALGLPLMPLLLRSRLRGAAWAGVTLLVAALVAALLADRPLLSLLSLYGGASSVALVAGMLGAYALGTTLDERARGRLSTAMLAGLCVNIAVAVLQGFVDLSAFRLAAPSGSYGLLGNPVHLGALLAGGVALVAARLGDSTRYGWPGWFAGVALIGFALPFSGSRIGFLAALLVALAVARPLGRRGIVLVAFLLAGFVAGELAHRAAPAVTASTSAKFTSTRAIQLEQRLDAWSAAAASSFDHPLGVGPGRFVVASQPGTTLRQARSSPDTSYLDAHNLVMEYLATTGFVGVVAFLAFLGLALAAGRGPFRWFAVGVLLIYLMQPQSLASIPLAFLALGVASPLPAGVLPTPARAGRLVLGVLAAALVATVLAGDATLRETDLSFDPGDGRLATRLLFAWPEPASKLGQVYVFAGTTDRRDPQLSARFLDDSEAALVDATKRDPAIATHWSNLADVQLFRRKVAEANASFGQALERNPYSLRALLGLAAAARLTGGTAAADGYIDRAAEIIPRAEVEALVTQRAGR